jgi:hypothetical protein
VSRDSTAAYLSALSVLDGIDRAEVDVEDRLDTIDLDAICDFPRDGSPAEMRDGGEIDVWELRQLQRWYVETLMKQVRRRAAVIKRVADRS